MGGPGSGNWHRWNTKEVVENYFRLDVWDKYLKTDLKYGLAGGEKYYFQDKPLAYIRVGFVKACKRAEIEDFTVHDLRHTAINNWRLQGHDYFRLWRKAGTRQ
jgi:integrase